MQHVTRGGAGRMRQRQSNSTDNVLHVQRFMPSRGDCLSAACARYRARKGRCVLPQPVLVVAGLMLAAAQARSKTYSKHLFQNRGRHAVKGWGVQPQPLLVVAGLMLAAAWPWSNMCLNHLFQNIGRGQ